MQQSSATKKHLSTRNYLLTSLKSNKVESNCPWHKTVSIPITNLVQVWITILNHQTSSPWMCWTQPWWNQISVELCNHHQISIQAFLIRVGSLFNLKSGTVLTPLRKLWLFHRLNSQGRAMMKSEWTNNFWSTGPKSMLTKPRPETI
jgi:hypothetical protein